MQSIKRLIKVQVKVIYFMLWAIHDIFMHFHVWTFTHEKFLVLQHFHTWTFMYEIFVITRLVYIWSFTHEIFLVLRVFFHTWSFLYEICPSLSSDHFTCEVSCMKFTHLFDKFSCVKLPIWNVMLFVIKFHRYICMKMSRLVHRNSSMC